jgi:hypothetical protein
MTTSEGSSRAAWRATSIAWTTSASTSKPARRASAAALVRV